VSPPRIFVVGTDTDVGKTSLVCALLSRAAANASRVLPYKPAQSGSIGNASDADRLCAAATIDGLGRDDIVAFDYALPIAPGMVGDGAHFLEATTADHAPLARCRAHLDHAIATFAPDLVIIEGAGGLWVPMPGGTWQPEWIGTLATHVVIVARAGLGTINHTLCTIDALRSLDLTTLGFYLCETTPPDASASTNARVIEVARGVAHLGTLPFSRAADSCLLAPLLARLA
jgi:dethiobiotin synthetase